MKKLVIFGLVFFLQGNMVWAQTVVTHETEKFFFKDGKMEKFEGQFENTYLLDVAARKLTRTRVYDYQTGKITPDETVYTVADGLNSYADHASNFSLLPQIVAFGQTGADSAELIKIDNESAETCEFLTDHLVISHAKRLK